jgi:hypothetical protein
MRNAWGGGGLPPSRIVAPAVRVVFDVQNAAIEAIVSDFSGLEPSVVNRE